MAVAKTSNNMYASPRITKINTLRKNKCTGHAACVGKGDMQKKFYNHVIKIIGFIKRNPLIILITIVFSRTTKFYEIRRNFPSVQ